MSKATFFVVILTSLQATASGMYFIDSNWRQGIYWLCAAVMSVVVSL